MHNGLLILYTFLLTKEAHQLGLIETTDYKRFISELYKHMENTWKGDKENDNSDKI